MGFTAGSGRKAGNIWGFGWLFTGKNKILILVCSKMKIN